MSINNIRILSQPISYQELKSFSRSILITGIYKIENTVNHKVYIGKSKNVIKRLNEHIYKSTNNHLRSSFEKYGLENFSFEILKQTYDLDYWEIFLIQIYHATDDKYGYNVATGGEGGNLGEKWYKLVWDSCHNEEYSKKISDSLKNSKKYQEVIHSKEFSDKIKKTKRLHPYRHNAEAKKKMSEFQKGRTRSEETRKRMSAAQKGHKVSKETREKISRAKRKYITNK